MGEERVTPVLSKTQGKIYPIITHPRLPLQRWPPKSVTPPFLAHRVSPRISAHMGKPEAFCHLPFFGTLYRMPVFEPINQQDVVWQYTTAATRKSQRPPPCLRGGGSPAPARRTARGRPGTTSPGPGSTRVPSGHTVPANSAPTYRLNFNRFQCLQFRRNYDSNQWKPIASLKRSHPQRPSARAPGRGVRGGDGGRPPREVTPRVSSLPYRTVVPRLECCDAGMLGTMLWRVDGHVIIPWHFCFCFWCYPVQSPPGYY